MYVCVFVCLTGVTFGQGGGKKERERYGWFTANCRLSEKILEYGGDPARSTVESERTRENCRARGGRDKKKRERYGLLRIAD